MAKKTDKKMVQIGFYAPPEIKLGIDEGQFLLRAMFSGEKNSRINRSLIIECAVAIALEEFRSQRECSRLAHEIKRHLQDG